MWSWKSKTCDSPDTKIWLLVLEGHKMPNGFVAFLDVLGFSNLVSGGEGDHRLRRYLESVNDVLSDSSEVGIDYVIFSDSIVLTTPEGSDSGLQVLIARCSKLLGTLLDAEIAIRGAIAHGSFVREVTGSGVFVAGKAVIDAYNFESKQDWVGMMLAPSARRQIPNLVALCQVQHIGHQVEALLDLTKRINWAGFLQRCPSIPFHTSSPFEDSSFDGFAIVPTSGIAEAQALRDSIAAAQKKLEWLKALAPDPSAQKKYTHTQGWLYQLHQHWDNIAYSIKDNEERAAASKQA
jgi:hypothetical protein